MVREAEQFKAEDDKVREGMKSRNELESLLFGTKAQIEGTGEQKLPLSEEDKKSILDKITEHQQWMEGNKMASKEDYDEKKKDFESLIHPIFAKF